jgi:hypothetical protein
MNTRGKMLDAKTREAVLNGKTRSMYIPEIFSVLEKFTKHDKAIALKNNAQTSIKEILRLSFDPKVEFQITAEELDGFKTNDMIEDYDLAGITLYNVAMRLKSFTNFREPLPTKIVERNFREMIYGMYVDDVEFLKSIVGQCIDYGITEELVREVFPDLLSPLEPEKVKPTDTPKAPEVPAEKKEDIKPQVPAEKKEDIKPEVTLTQEETEKKEKARLKRNQSARDRRAKAKKGTKKGKSKGAKKK